MLRIFDTEIREGSKVLRLEGRLVGLWLEELRRAIDPVLDKPQVLQLDLAGVSFLDLEAVAFLRGLQERGVAVVNSSPFVAEQLSTSSD